MISDIWYRHHLVHRSLRTKPLRSHRRPVTSDNSADVISPYEDMYNVPPIALIPRPLSRYENAMIIQRHLIGRVSPPHHCPRICATQTLIHWGITSRLWGCQTQPGVLCCFYLGHLHRVAYGESYVLAGLGRPVPRTAERAP